MKNKKDWKILIVEDGSVDVEKLQKFIDEKNLPVYICVYRQGSAQPKFIEEKDERINRF